MSGVQCDVAIIGGGPVGTALALALRDNDLDVVLLEARDAATSITDPRALALSCGSRLLLQRLGIWETLPNVSSIRTIEVSQQDPAARATLRAGEMDLAEMGCVLPYAALHAALRQTLHQSGTACRYGTLIGTLAGTGTEAVLTFTQQGQQHTLKSRLAVVADGGQLLQATHPPRVTDYGQSGIIAHVSCTRPCDGVAFEHFTAQGPMALLPYQEGYELVLTAPHDLAREMLQWEDAAFLHFLQEHFGDRVGTFTRVGRRNCYPLSLKRAPDITLPRTVLIGNAAQTLHPVAGQGFNLGLRDAWELAQVILDHTPDDIGSAAMCAEYRRSRRLDRNAAIFFTDGLVRLFSNDLPLLGHARSAALTLLDHLPPVKGFLAKRMMFGANG